MSSPATRPRVPHLGAILAVGALVVLPPLLLDAGWLQAGILGASAAIAAIGLTLLVGHAGQVSLGHAFFVAVGAYGYAAFAGAPGGEAAGLGWSPLPAAAAAVLLAGAAGAAFSPVAQRVGGIYLAIASLGLVFAGQHVLINAVPLTGGFAGRSAPPLQLPGLDLSGPRPLWYASALLLAGGVVVARRVIDSRVGRAFMTVRDDELAAAAMGVDVRRTKRDAFVLSSAYGGLAGVLLAASLGYIVPEAFTFVQSVDYLAMVAIGGVTSVGGGVVGALLVVALPQVLGAYGQLLGLADPGTGGVGPAEAARFAYGLAIVVILIAEPGGLGALGRRMTRPLRRPPRTDSAPPRVPRHPTTTPVE